MSNNNTGVRYVDIDSLLELDVTDAIPANQIRGMTGGDACITSMNDDGEVEIRPIDEV